MDEMAEANRSAKWRGHSLVWEPAIPTTRRDGTSPVWIGTCEYCGMQVVANSSPPPNGISVGGEAVTLNCTGNQGE